MLKIFLIFKVGRMLHYFTEIVSELPRWARWAAAATSDRIRVALPPPSTRSGAVRSLYDSAPEPMLPAGSRSLERPAAA